MELHIETRLPARGSGRRYPTTLKLLELSALEGHLARQALALYETSFPLAERLPVDHLAMSLRERVGPDWLNHFWVLVDGETLLGLAIFSYYGNDRLALLKYLAIQTHLQGQGYGSLLFRRMLRQVWEDAMQLGGQRPLGLCFEVERPEAAANAEEQTLRRRRIAFYQRHGAELVEQLNYVGPALYEGLPPPLCYVMFRPIPGRQTTLAETELAAIMRLILSHSYKLAPDDPFIQATLASLNCAASASSPLALARS